MSESEILTDELLRASIDSLRELGDLRNTAYALCYLGGCEKLYGGKASKYCEEGLELFRSIGDNRGAALALRGLGWTALHSANYSTSKERFQDSLILYRQIGDQTGITTTLGALGYANWILGNYAQAEQLHLEMLALCRGIGDPGGIARALGDLGIDSFGLKRYEQAQDYWKQSLALYREIGNPWGIADELGDLGAGSLALGDYFEAIRFAQESLSIHWMGRPDFDFQAWELRVVGHAYIQLGDASNARKYLYQALRAGEEAHIRSRALLTLIPIALLLNHEGYTERALEYLFLVTHHPISWQMARDHAAPLIATLAAGLPVQVVAAAEARGRQRDLGAAIAELLEELVE